MLLWVPPGAPSSFPFSPNNSHHTVIVFDLGVSIKVTPTRKSSALARGSLRLYKRRFPADRCGNLGKGNQTKEPLRVLVAKIVAIRVSSDICGLSVVWRALGSTLLYDRSYPEIWGDGVIDQCSGPERFAKGTHVETLHWRSCKGISGPRSRR